MPKRRFEINAETMPDLPGMMLAMVEALRTLGGSAKIQELDTKVIELEGVTEAEQALTMPDGNRTRVNYYLAWARTYLKGGGALTNSSRGVWALTEESVGIVSHGDARAIYEQATREAREQARTRRQSSPPKNAVEPKEDFPEVDDPWRSSLLAVLGAMPPDAFERLSQQLLREAGFTKVEVRGKPGDGGIDGVGVLRVKLVSFKIYFQCKRWKGSIGAKDVRDFRGAVQGRADKGLFITTGTFTSQASDEATREGAIEIDLIDGDDLCDLLKENRLGVETETEMIEKVRIRPEWFERL